MIRTAVLIGLMGGSPEILAFTSSPTNSFLQSQSRSTSDSDACHRDRCRFGAVHNGCTTTPAIVRMDSMTTELMMVSAGSSSSSSPMTEDQAQYILNKARECAFMDGNLVDDILEHGGPTSSSSAAHFQEDEVMENSAEISDTTSPEKSSSTVITTTTNNNSNAVEQHTHFTVDDARYLLREMIHIQSNCVTGTIVGHDLCDDQDTAAEIVAKLRYKIDKYERQLAKRQKGSESVVPWIATELSVGALVLVVAVFWTTLDMSSSNVIGGDVDDMMASSSSAASSSSIQLNNFFDWFGVFQERYLGDKGTIISSV